MGPDVKMGRLLFFLMRSLATMQTENHHWFVGESTEVTCQDLGPRVEPAERSAENSLPLTRQGEREAIVPVLMELKRIIINEIHDQQIILLNEVEGERSFPIVIGMFEALSIDRRVKGVQWPRPMTHDLICNVIDHLGGDLQDIYINELRDHTYFAKLRVRKDGELVEVDCRPSDAIAVAVTAKVPIYVAEDVIEEASEEQ
jgi:bifunctional DNase/RNase